MRSNRFKLLILSVPRIVRLTASRQRIKSALLGSKGLLFRSTVRAPHTLPLLFDFPLDMARVPAEVNRLSNQVLVTTYEQEWGRLGQ